MCVTGPAAELVFTPPPIIAPVSGPAAVPAAGHEPAAPMMALTQKVPLEIKHLGFLSTMAAHGSPDGMRLP